MKHPLSYEEIAQLKNGFPKIPHLVELIMAMYIKEGRGELQHIIIGHVELGSREGAKAQFSWRFWEQPRWSFWEQPELPTQTLRRLVREINEMPTWQQKKIDDAAKAWAQPLKDSPDSLPDEADFVLRPMLQITHQPTSNGS